MKMKVIAHRGASALAPENTWQSFDLAVKLGADAIETDIQATQDGELILFHDHTLDRTTNGQGKVSQSLYSQIEQLDAGSWFDVAYRGAKVPLLQDTLLGYAKKIHFILEIKLSGIELEVLKMVQQLELIDAVTFTSFDIEVIKNMRNHSSQVNLEWLATKSEQLQINQACELGIKHISLPASIITSELVAHWNTLGVDVGVWQVKDSQMMLQVINTGIVAMTIDFPHLLTNLLN